MRALGVLFGLLALPALADMQVDGQVTKPHDWTVGELKALPAASAEVTYFSGRGEEHARFTGVPLWALLDQAGLADTSGKHADLRHSVTVTGRDGYAIAVAFGEFDPDFEGKQVLVAYERDGKPIDGLQLVMPGDKRGARYVHDVVRIEVK